MDRFMEFTINRKSVFSVWNHLPSGYARIWLVAGAKIFSLVSATCPAPSFLPSTRHTSLTTLQEACVLLPLTCIFCMAMPMLCSAVSWTPWAKAWVPPLRSILVWVSITAWLSLARPRISSIMSPAMMGLLHLRGVGLRERQTDIERKTDREHICIR